MSDDLEAADIWGDSNENNQAANASSSDNNPAAAEPVDNEDDETRTMSNQDLRTRIRLLDNDIRVMKSDVQRLKHEERAQKERIRENVEKVKMNKQLPYLVGNVIEVLEPDAEDGEFLNGCVIFFRSIMYTYIYLLHN